MTQDEIIEMARQSGCGHESITLDWICPENLEIFTKLVAEAAASKEREACAKVCDDIRHPWGYSAETSDWCRGAEHCADAIRSRGVK